jgi:electron transport complex protein RnfC
VVHRTRNWPAQPPPFEALDPGALEAAGAAGAAQAIGAVDPGSGDLSFWIDRLSSLGVRAGRRASPNLSEQLNAALRRPIDAIICHALDADPAACVLGAWAAAHVEEVVAGVALLARITKATTRLVVLDERAPSGWWSRLRPAARGAGLKVIALENDYPQSDPTLLLYTLLNRRLRPGRLPVEQGVLMLDGAAAVAVGAAELRGEPMSRLPLAIRDHDLGESFFVTAPIGFTVGQVLAILQSRASVPSEVPGILRQGDVLRDLRIDSAALVGTSELTLHVSTAPPPINPEPCVRCGWCYEVCPTRVQPAAVLEAAQRNDIDLAERAGLESCIECGLCTYVCPSKLPLLAGIRTFRKST